jgi:hypothetical protein
VLHVVFASPHDLHGFADRLRCLDGIAYKIRFTTATETTAEIRRMNLHRLGLQARRRNCGLVRRRLSLSRNPDIAAVGAHIRRAIHRLHRGMREERQFVNAVKRFRIAL